MWATMLFILICRTLHESNRNCADYYDIVHIQCVCTIINIIIVIIIALLHIIIILETSYITVNNVIFIPFLFAVVLLSTGPGLRSMQPMTSKINITASRVLVAGVRDEYLFWLLRKWIGRCIQHPMTALHNDISIIFVYTRIEKHEPTANKNSIKNSPKIIQIRRQISRDQL